MSLMKTIQKADVLKRLRLLIYLSDPRLLERSGVSVKQTYMCVCMCYNGIPGRVDREIFGVFCMHGVC